MPGRASSMSGTTLSAELHCICSDRTPISCVVGYTLKVLAHGMTGYGDSVYSQPSALITPT
jgi:hypothetical protein